MNKNQKTYNNSLISLWIKSLILASEVLQLILLKNEIKELFSISKRIQLQR